MWTIVITINLYFCTSFYQILPERYPLLKGCFRRIRLCNFTVAAATVLVTPSNGFGGGNFVIMSRTHSSILNKGPSPFAAGVILSVYVTLYLASPPTADLSMLLHSTALQEIILLNFTLYLHFLCFVLSACLLLVSLLSLMFSIISIIP